MISITIGANGTGTAYAVTAVEILPSISPREREVEPEQILRRRWNPPRSQVFSPVLAPTQSGQLVYNLGTQLPVRHIRTRWEPPRSQVFSPTLGGGSQVVVPRDPVPPVLPERFLRGARWDPPRSHNVFPAGTGFTSSHAFLVVPSTVFVNVPFTVNIVVSNPTSQVARIQQAVPQWLPDDNEPAEFGQVYLASQPSLPPQVTALLGSGFIVLPPGQTVTFGVGAVIFRAGQETMQALVFFQDGSTQIAGPATVTAVSVT
jgi:hypothetical protein